MSGPLSFRSLFVRVSPFFAAATLALPFTSATLSAQAASYPALQVPTASVRDYTGAISSGPGTSALFQWREGVSNSMHLGLDVGLMDRKGSNDLRLFFGGSVGSELIRATGDQPLDVLLTGGAGLSTGDGITILRVPFGASVGHTFELDQGMALTPFVHPRISLDFCSNCGRSSKSELSINFDVGADFQINRQMSLRAALMFSGSDYFGSSDAFAIGLNWRPAALR